MIIRLTFHDDDEGLVFKGNGLNSLPSCAQRAVHGLVGAVTPAQLMRAGVEPNPLPHLGVQGDEEWKEERGRQRESGKRRGGGERAAEKHS